MSSENTTVAFLGGFIIGAILIGILAISLTWNNYKIGQINALTGKIDYKLMTKSDSSRIWVKIKENK